jgi:integrase
VLAVTMDIRVSGRLSARRNACGDTMLVILTNEENDYAGRRNLSPGHTQAPPWNKGKLIGAKPPLRPKHVWTIRTKLQVADRKRDLAMFNLAIDSKLRGCDVVALKVEDIAPHGYAVERATVRQKKTGVPVRFEVTEQTRQAVDDYIRATNRKPVDFLFAAPRRPAGACRPRNIHALSATGFVASVSIPACSGLIRCAGPRPH